MGDTLHNGFNTDDIEISISEVENPLGHLYGFTIRKGMLPYELLMSRMDELDIPEDERPKEPRLKDKFKYLIRELEDTEQEIINDITVRVAITIRKITTTEYLAIKEIIRPKDMAQKDSDKILELKAKESSRIKFDPDTGEITAFDYNTGKRSKDKPDIQLQQKLTQRLDEIKGCVMDKQVRDNFRQNVLSQKYHSIPFSSSAGGLWFSLAENYQHINKHQQLIEWFAQNYNTAENKSSLRVLPVLDRNKERKYIMEDIELELQKQFKTLMDKLIDNIQNGKNVSKLIQARTDVKKYLVEMKTKYENMLGKPIKLIKDTKQTETLINVALGRFKSMKLGQDNSEAENIKDGILEIIDMDQDTNTLQRFKNIQMEGQQ